MKPNWRELPRDSVVGQWTTIYVTLNKKGYIVMSRLTYQRMGEPKAFVLLFDTVNNKIGLQPSAPGVRNAYPVGPSGRHGGKLIRAYRMLHEFGIDVPETLHFRDAAIDNDGLLILDLRTARVSARAKTLRKESTKRIYGPPL